MQFDREKYRQTLLESIIGSKIASGGDEINCRCFYCADSKHKDHGHFYISIPKDNTEPSTFYCQKCHASGMVDHSILSDWGIFNIDISTMLLKYNKEVMKLSKNVKYNNKDVIYNLANNYVTEDEWSYKKLKYINNRLGLDFNYDDIRKNKIVLNLYDLLNYNKITTLTRHKNICDQLNRMFIGFISYDNAFLNMRRVCKEGIVYEGIDKRYVNYHIFDKIDNTKRFYIIPTQVDIIKPEPIQLHLCEGAFDALSIKYNLRKKEDAIYASINGSGYLGMLKFFISNMCLMNLEIHIYPDKDIDDSKMYYIADQIAAFKNPIYIHRNIMPNEKDFGVPLDRIKEHVWRLL